MAQCYRSASVRRDLLQPARPVRSLREPRRLENGSKVLDYMEVDERFSAASFKDSMEEQGIAVNRNDLLSLIDNMRSLSKLWRSSIVAHGELVFYIDAC
jgi:hypothetical protein